MDMLAVISYIKILYFHSFKKYKGNNNNNNNNNNLRFIVVKTNRSTLHTLYDIQQSATQGSNNTTHRLPRRTAATTRFSPEGIGCQKQTAPRFLPTSDQVGLYLASIHQMAPPEHTGLLGGIRTPFTDRLRDRQTNAYNPTA